jgi:hypothetical protein
MCSFLKISAVAKKLGFFIRVNSDELFGQRTGLGYILGDLFTNSSSHPARLTDLKKPASLLSSEKLKHWSKLSRPH